MYTNIELFAGWWWLALWMEKAGFEHTLLNDFDKYCTSTLKTNRPKRNVVEWDVSEIDFKPYLWQVDLLSWWYPCQAFSYAWKQLWFNDNRWILFLQFARALNECKPKMFLAENVKWLISHDWWNTLKKMIEVFEDSWYTVIEPKVLNATDFWVPQKRSRIIIIGIRNDLYKEWIFERPAPLWKIYTLKDALKKWDLYDCDVPKSEWQKYPEKKKKVLDLVPPWWYWRDLPIDVQKLYMKKSFYLGWWKTGMARRISWDEPCLTLTCSPSQWQTERCHPDETRPFTVREYARIQTFPDDWEFSWGIAQQYKQIWNAVPINLWFAIGKSIKSTLDKINSFTSK